MFFIHLLLKPAINFTDFSTQDLALASIFRDLSDLDSDFQATEAKFS